VTLRLDHLLTFVADLDAHLATYRRAGFLTNARTARWDPGLRNGFVRLWPEYLEFLWVEDEAAFAEGGARYYTLGGPDCHTVRQAGRPYGVGFYSDDVPALHEHWRARGYDLPKVAYWRLKGTPPEVPPDFAYQEIPLGLLPGAACFALTSYHPDPPQRREVWVAPNGSHALAGVSFVTGDPEARAAAWRRFLAPEAALRSDEGASHLHLGPHHLSWLTPDAYRQRYGKAWQPTPHALGELALTHLLAEDLGLFERGLAAAGWRVTRSADALQVAPHPEGGFAFSVTEYPADARLAERVAVTGERLELMRG